MLQASRGVCIGCALIRATGASRTQQWTSISRIRPISTLPARGAAACASKTPAADQLSAMEALQHSSYASELQQAVAAVELASVLCQVHCRDSAASVLAGSAERACMHRECRSSSKPGSSARRTTSRL